MAKPNVRDPKIWGPYLWQILHYITTTYQVENKKEYAYFFCKIVPHILPCKPCRQHFRMHMKRHPIQLESREKLVQWLFIIHNVVNKILGKPRYKIGVFRKEQSLAAFKEKTQCDFMKFVIHVRPLLAEDRDFQSSYSEFVSFVVKFV